MTIVNDNSRVINKLKTYLTDDARVVIYDRHMFIVHVTGQPHLTVLMNEEIWMLFICEWQQQLNLPPSKRERESGGRARIVALPSLNLCETRQHILWKNEVQLCEPHHTSNHWYYFVWILEALWLQKINAEWQKNSNWMERISFTA